MKANIIYNFFYGQKLLLILLTACALTVANKSFCSVERFGLCSLSLDWFIQGDANDPKFFDFVSPEASKRISEILKLQVEQKKEQMIQDQLADLVEAIQPFPELENKLIRLLWTEIPLDKSTLDWIRGGEKSPITLDLILKNENEHSQKFNDKTRWMILISTLLDFFLQKSQKGPDAEFTMESNFVAPSLDSFIDDLLLLAVFDKKTNNLPSYFFSSTKENVIQCADEYQQALQSLQSLKRNDFEKLNEIYKVQEDGIAYFKNYLYNILCLELTVKLSKDKNKLSKDEESIVKKIYNNIRECLCQQKVSLEGIKDFVKYFTSEILDSLDKPESGPFLQNKLDAFYLKSCR